MYLFLTLTLYYNRQKLDSLKNIYCASVHTAHLHKKNFLGFTASANGFIRKTKR